MKPSSDTDKLTPPGDGAGYVMPASSKYAGMPVDMSTRRSVEIHSSLSGEDLIAENDRHAIVDFVYHEGKYWRARIPLDGVGVIVGQAFNFSKPRTRTGPGGREIIFDKRGLPKRTIPFLNHVQCRFVMKPDAPIQLYPLEYDDLGHPEHEIYDLVYSVEVMGPAGVDFNLSDAFRGNFLSAHRFLSVHEMVFERLVVQNQVVTESPPLPLDESAKRQLLVRSLIRSHRAGLAETYHMFRVCGTSNCTSNPLQILDNVVDYSLLQRLGSLIYRLPLSPRFYLRIRGLDSDPSYRKLVKSEFEDWIQDDVIQQRKRTFVREQIRIRRAARSSPDSKPVEN